MMYVHFYTMDGGAEEWYGPFAEVWFEGLSIHVKPIGCTEYAREFASYDSDPASINDWVSPQGVSYVDMDVVGEKPSHIVVDDWH